ncbi:hypothetical protein [Hymenobacter metallilatus]|uniref:Uncharacterized protein n=1 Tax=Hymenobacter metallilatus TaxID=2493666 RepID=A0A428IYF9_9BACT|nr:hypothetical protein [Hymenobacter metallilatus]RSK24187.1 hypothetical protein EI290_20620 [Hymenobacter metallilatus]
MAQDLMYPPGRKRPSGSNTVARPRRENTPRSAAQTPAAAEIGGFSTTSLLLVALAGGAALAWFRAGTTSASQLPASLPATGTSTPTPPKPTTSTPTGTKLPTRLPTVGPMTPGRLVFVQSLNGETIYERLRSTGGFPDGYGLPSTAITMIPNGTWLGYLTGKEFQPSPNYPRMLQVYATNGSDFRVNFWVDAEEVVVFGQADADAYMRRGVGKNMTADAVNAIKSFFLNKYGT